VSDFDVTVTGLDELEATFGRVQAGALPMVDAIVSKGALNVKGDAKRRISGLAHAPAYPASIGYDLYHTPFTSSARIGPDKAKRQGPLGNILEYGTVKNAPIPHLTPALDAEAPKFERAIADAAAKLWDQT
jgi:hypothetical protein